jgi:phosphopantothenoylcysteine decarboxylase/phosphopantothenate--cysteine ligase
MLMSALSKLKSKQLDMIAANDISAPDSGFGVDTNRITLLFPDGSQEPLPLMSKTEAAETIIARMAVLLESK